MTHQQEVYEFPEGHPMNEQLTELEQWFCDRLVQGCRLRISRCISPGDVTYQACGDFVGGWYYTEGHATPEEAMASLREKMVARGKDCRPPINKSPEKQVSTTGEIL